MELQRAAGEGLIKWRLLLVLRTVARDTNRPFTSTVQPLTRPLIRGVYRRTHPLTT